MGTDGKELLEYLKGKFAPEIAKLSRLRRLALEEAKRKEQEAWEAALDSGEDIYILKDGKLSEFKREDI